MSVKVNVGHDDCHKCLVVSPGSAVETFVEIETAGKCRKASGE